MCDVESFIYLPLLEETGYIPKHKYSYGAEIRYYANLIADTHRLRDKASFQMETKDLTWDENAKDWTVKITHGRTSTDSGRDLTVRAQFVIAAGGLLNNPKLPGIKGIGDFKGHSFHTSRWDYEYTGGVPPEPSLSKLAGKTVGIIGTGATCIQALPYLTKYAKEVYVFQRTPSAVDVRNNAPTDAKWFEEQVAKKGGWQKERAMNFNAFITNTNPKPEIDMVNDAWSQCSSFSALIGSPTGIGLTPEKIPGKFTLSLKTCVGSIIASVWDLGSGSKVCLVWALS
jgi:cation diffusion facilitator CzcD-associated flavoprotein CzcO